MMEFIVFGTVIVVIFMIVSVFRRKCKNCGLKSAYQALTREELSEQGLSSHANWLKCKQCGHMIQFAYDDYVD